VTKPTKQSYSFEFKLALVERFLAGETAPDLAAEADLSSPVLVKTWVRAYRREGADALRPKPKGRPRKPDTHHRRRHPSWSYCAGKTNGCGQKWPIWENYGP
jgi:transposase-like protein